MYFAVYGAYLTHCATEKLEFTKDISQKHAYTHSCRTYHLACPYTHTHTHIQAWGVEEGGDYCLRGRGLAL